MVRFKVSVCLLKGSEIAPRLFMFMRKVCACGDASLTHAHFAQSGAFLPLSALAVKLKMTGERLSVTSYNFIKLDDGFCSTRSCFEDDCQTLVTLFSHARKNKI